MNFFGLSVLLAYSPFLYTNLAFQSSQDYYDYDPDQEDALESSEPDLEEQLRSAGSVDELMRLLYPSYWNTLKCRSKLGAVPHFSSREHKEQPSAESRMEEMTFAAAYINLDMFKSIEAEWRKTQCMPREVCLDVGKEFGAATNTFYKPPCVSVYRCGGCCNSEEYQCMNITTSYISKTLFEITVPVKQPSKPVTISFANHTSCTCLSKLDVYRQRHSIIRRALPECHAANKTCSKNQSWSNSLCRCVSHSSLFPQHYSDSFDQDFCGPNKELDEDTCQCLCRKDLRTAGCGPRRYLDKNTCQCSCKSQPTSCGPHQTFNKNTCQCSCKTQPTSCGPHQTFNKNTCQCSCKTQPTSCGPQQTFNKDTCQCTCNRACPADQPLNRTKCVCECTESSNKCFLRARRFQAATCSCYRLPCHVDPKKRRCEEGLFFSEEVCRCVPDHWRRWK